LRCTLPIWIPGKKLKWAYALNARIDESFVFQSIFVLYVMELKSNQLLGYS